MKQLTRSLISLFLLAACGTYHTVVYEPAPDPVVTENGLEEEVIGYTEVKVDTSFAHPGMDVLLDLPMDEIYCKGHTCYATYTEQIPIVARRYYVTVQNRGDEAAYGLTTTLQIRSEYQDGYHSHTYVEIQDVEFYLADVLEPGWEVSLNYELAENESVLDFLGILWDDYTAYSAKDPGAYLHKKSNKRNFKVEKRKMGDV